MPTASVGSSQAPTAAVDKSLSASNTKIQTAPLERPVAPGKPIVKMGGPTHTLLHPTRLEMIYGTHSFGKDGTLLPTHIEDQPYDRKTSSRVWKIEEKKTDVNLAMAMYRDAVKGRYDQAVLSSNESDCEPVIAAMREDFPEITIGVVTQLLPPIADKPSHRGVSTSLAKYAHWTRRYVLDTELQQTQLPAQVPTKKNRSASQHLGEPLLEVFLSAQASQYSIAFLKRPLERTGHETLGSQD